MRLDIGNIEQGYRFSLTGASLLVIDFVALANDLIHTDYDYSKISNDNMDRERQATRRREITELQLRMQTLSRKEILYLTQTSSDNQRLISFLSCIRLYRILREFVEEVIWGKLVVFDDHLHSRDFTGFLYNKGLDFPEVENLSETTKKKVEQVCFKILEQASLIDGVRSKKILIPYLDYSLEHILSRLDKKYLLNL